MNRLKKIFSILLMVALLVNTFLGSTSKNVFADGTLKTELKIININGDNTIDENTEFWVNKPIPAAVDLSISGTGVNLKNTKLKVSVQKTDSATRPDFADSKKAIANERSEDSNYYYMTYTFDQLNGGTQLALPLPFKFLESANKGDSVTVKAELVDENQVPLATITKTYVANKETYTFNDSSVYANTPDYQQERIDPSKPAKNNTLFVKSVDTYEDTEKTSADGEGTILRAILNATMKDTSAVNPNATYDRPKNIKYELKLPEGVEMVDANAFSFDPATRIATRVVNNPGIDGAFASSYNELTFFVGPTLKFKEKKYNEVINLEAKFTINDGLADERKLPDRTLPIKLLKNKQTFSPANWSWVYKNSIRGTETDPFTYSLGERGTYTAHHNKIFDDRNNDQSENGLFYITEIGNENNGSSPSNPGGGQVMHLWSIEDTLMKDPAVQSEKKIYYKYFQLAKVEKFRDRGGDATRRQQLVDNTINQLNSTSNKLYGIKEDGSKVELASNVKYQQKVDINDTTGQYVRLSLEFDTPITLDNTSIKYYTAAFPSDKEIKKVQDGEYSAIQYYYGAAKIKSEIATSSTGKDNATETSNAYANDAYTGLKGLTPKAWIGGFNGTDTLIYKGEDTYADITLNPATLRGRYGVWGPYLGQPVTNVKVLFLLPAEFSYVQTHSNTYTNVTNGSIGEPEIVKNFRNTGRTAVIYSVPDMTPTLEDKNDAVGIALRVKASPYAKQGNNEVDAYFLYDNNDIIQPWDANQTYVDALDLDGDGNQTEKFSYMKHTINFVPPLELLVSKQVGLTPNNTKYAEVGDLGQTFYWNVTISNNTISEVTDVSFIDTLPYVGDRVITPNNAGQYAERGSKFTTPLANSLESVSENTEVLKDFDVFYQLAPQGTIESVRDGSWLTASQVTDFSQVKSIKLVLKAGSKLESKKTVNFYIPAKIPFDTTLTETQTANNTAAVSTDKTSYSEGNTASIGIAKYTVKGTVFSDFNKDGIMGSDESKLKDYKVELIDKATNDVAVDANGNKLEATTDDEGKYKFDVYKRGDYFVRFTKKSSDEKLTKSNDKVDGNNATEEISGTDKVKTADFTLSPTRKDVVKNAAFEATKRDVTIKKISSKLEQGGAKKYLKGVTFALKQNGNVVDTQTTDDNGQAVFKNVKFGNYKLEETATLDGYERITTEKDITVDETGDATYEISNNPIVGKIVATLEDKDDSTKKLAGVKFELKSEDGTVITEGTTDTDGKVVFNDVPYGKYKLVQKTALTDYDKAEDTEVSVTTQGQEAAVTIKNKLNPTTPAPVINTVDTDDEKITGTGINGATIEVTLPDGTKKTTTVNSEGKWEVPTPKLAKDAVVKATQKEEDKKVSAEATTTVVETIADKTTLVDPAKTKVDNLAQLTTAEKAKVKAEVEKANPTLPAGTTIEVADNGEVKVTFSDKSEAKIPAAKTVVERETSATPVIDKVDTDDKKVTGTGVAGATIEVTLPDGTKKAATVNSEGKWEVSLDTPLAKDAVVKATQKEEDKKVSAEATTTVVETAAQTIKPNKPDVTDVVNPGNLTQDEKNKIADAVKKANPTLPNGTKIVVDNNGDVTIKYPDGSESKIPAKDTTRLVEKTPANPDEKQEKKSNKRSSLANTGMGSTETTILGLGLTFLALVLRRRAK